MNWLVSLPVWGQDYVDTFLAATLPSIRAAMQRSNARFQFLVNTDGRGCRDMQPAFTAYGLDVLWRPLAPADEPHGTLGAAHREAIQRAPEGAYVAFLTADIVLSAECFSAAEKRFSQGKQLVIAAASRSLRSQRQYVPMGTNSRKLLEWTVQYQHPSITDCYWPKGSSIVPWAVYFKGPNGIVLRGFHLHPFAAVKSQRLAFDGLTVDHDLCDCFDEKQIHVVTDPDEMALAELSPLNRQFAHLPFYFNERYIAEWAADRATPRQQWCFNHRIVIQGDGSDGVDLAPCDRVNGYLKGFKKEAA